MNNLDSLNISSRLKINIKMNRWLIKLRWWVPPFIFFGAIIASIIGYEFLPNAMYILAFVILIYNSVLHFLIKNTISAENITSDFGHLSYWQVGLDYAALFFLAQFTGGTASPFIFFFLFHIIFASILLPLRSAYIFAFMASAGMVILATAEYLQWIPHHAIIFKDRAIDLAHQPAHMVAELLFFTISVFIAAFFLTGLKKILGKTLDEPSGQ